MKAQNRFEEMYYTNNINRLIYFNKLKDNNKKRKMLHDKQKSKKKDKIVFLRLINIACG